MIILSPREPAAAFPQVRNKTMNESQLWDVIMGQNYVTRASVLI